MNSEDKIERLFVFLILSVAMFGAAFQAARWLLECVGLTWKMHRVAGGLALAFTVWVRWLERRAFLRQQAKTHLKSEG